MEAKEILEALGLPGDLDSKEKIVEAHRGKYVATEDAHEEASVRSKIEGKVNGTILTELKRSFGLTPEQVKDKTIVDLLKETATTTKAKIQELEGAASNDERYNKTKAELDKIQGLYTQATADLQKTAELLETEKKSAATKIKEFKTSDLYKQAKGKITFGETVSETTKIGFDTIFNQKYVLDIDDQDVVTVLDKAGKKIPNKTKAGEYMNLEQILAAEAEEQGLVKKNNLDGKQKVNFLNNGNGQQNQNQHQQSQGNNGIRERRISPKAVEHAERSAAQG